VGVYKTPTGLKELLGKAAISEVFDLQGQRYRYKKEKKERGTCREVKEKKREVNRSLFKATLQAQAEQLSSL